MTIRFFFFPPKPHKIPSMSNLLPKQPPPQSRILADLVAIFDLDGTLVDSAPDLAGAMNHVLATQDLPALPLATVRHLVGNGAKALLARGFALYQRPPPTESEMAAHITQFIHHYQAHIADRSTPYPGCHRILEKLQSQGAKLAVCTNKTEALAFDLLAALDLTRFFDCIVCRDTLSVCKPAPEPLFACQTRTHAKKAVMIGDTMTDLDAATAAQMPCLIARFGYGKFTPDTKNLQQFDHFDELPELISGLQAQ